MDSTRFGRRVSKFSLLLRQGLRRLSNGKKLGLVLMFVILTVLGFLVPFLALQSHIKKTETPKTKETEEPDDNLPEFQEPEIFRLNSTNATDEPPEQNQGRDIAVVVLAARRPEVHQVVNQLLAQKPASGFRLLMSLDGTEKQTTAVLQQIKSNEVKLLRLADDKSRNFTASSDSYVKIARHYLRVLDYLILKLNFSYVILMEDDMLIAPDFYQYFRSLRRALDSDESIFCVSAWNDNGQIGLVTEDPQLLHRTDFFPGLGWMINRRHWLQIREFWPKTQYDDFLRHYMMNNSLVCVRPELSRTFNIGRNGGRSSEPGKSYAYGDIFYHNYLSRMALNTFNVTLTKSAIDKVIGRSADHDLDKFARSLPAMNVSQLLSMPVQELPPAVRLRYATVNDFIELALSIGAIPEVWFGAPRASILSISMVSVRGSRVFIVPDKRLPVQKKIYIPRMKPKPKPKPESNPAPSRRFWFF
ncbi:hypothetical protein BOX15_Mlig021685g1 [Macrostomum lignano]|uniref:Alpha-1,3-mannosyl-glycoprotein 2-beta-N-acetylglucosaminyltransferase n=1 Tax=Macrostomum lignano TaxID=282301 RepID=A0A267DIM3_9PLAT|nr:hypothetical protein BOX15_Mlig021685g1 [Macrostomum lignano]